MTAPTATEIAASVLGQRTRAVDVCAAALQRISTHNPQLNAFLEVFDGPARARAAEIDRAIAAGRPVGPLAGVPVAIKDNICTRLGHTTCASAMLANFKAPYDATVVQRLAAAGAVVLGKTNMDEFAMGSSTENSARGVTPNPWALDRVPGGSSGGSAASVAARLVPLALGSDTGGSVRQPAALCGVLGLKPTYGRVSRFGLVAYGSSLEQIGPLATCTADLALLLGVIAGPDPADATSLPGPVSAYLPELGDSAVTERGRGLRIGVPREYLGAGLDGDTRAALEAALTTLADAGARRVEVALPNARFAIAAYYVIATAEASSNLARYDGVHYGHRTARPRDIFELYSASRDEGFGAEVKRRIMLGTFVLSAGYHDAYYDRALRVRRLIRNDFAQAFATCDVIVGPTAPTAAFRLGEKLDDPLAMYLADIYTVPANLAGLPALSVPCGFTPAGLPIGMQLVGPAGGESLLLQTARLHERATDWHQRVPAAPGGG